MVIRGKAEEHGAAYEGELLHRKLVRGAISKSSVSVQGFLTDESGHKKAICFI